MTFPVNRRRFVRSALGMGAAAPFGVVAARTFGASRIGGAAALIDTTPICRVACASIPIIIIIILPRLP
jgi:hypothetical protein